jgi:hypothetical protein
VSCGKNSFWLANSGNILVTLRPNHGMNGLRYANVFACIPRLYTTNTIYGSLLFSPLTFELSLDLKSYNIDAIFPVMRNNQQMLIYRVKFIGVYQFRQYKACMRLIKTRGCEENMFAGMEKETRVLQTVDSLTQHGTQA